jgi:hypothetical protein
MGQESIYRKALYLVSACHITASACLEVVANHPRYETL